MVVTNFPNLAGGSSLCECVALWSGWDFYPKPQVDSSRLSWLELSSKLKRSLCRSLNTSLCVSLSFLVLSIEPSPHWSPQTLSFISLCPGVLCALLGLPYPALHPAENSLKGVSSAIVGLTSFVSCLSEITVPPCLISGILLRAVLYILLIFWVLQGSRKKKKIQFLLLYLGQKQSPSLLFFIYFYTVWVFTACLVYSLLRHTINIKMKWGNNPSPEVACDVSPLLNSISLHHPEMGILGPACQPWLALAFGKCACPSPFSSQENVF